MLAPGLGGASLRPAATPSLSSLRAPPGRGGSRAADDPDVRALIRVFMANRGVWESGWWLGPTVSVAHTAEDVDQYVETFGACLAALT